MFEIYLRNLTQVLCKIECTDNVGDIAAAQGVDRVVAKMAEVKNAGAKILWVGNGGSASIVAHSSTDYFRTGNFKTQCFNEASLITCLANDFGYAEVFVRPIELYADPDDLLVAISSSGQSANILNAVQTARRKGCTIITLSGFEAGNPLRKSGNVNFYVPSKEYGFVELTHGFLCHGFLDVFMQGTIK